ncbi:hypothetical protein IC575_005503 [Cucumis melo]
MILLFAWMLFLVEIYVVNVAEIGKEDEVSGNIGSGSMFAWVCSWSVWIVGKAVNNFLKKMGISLHFHP